MSSSYPNATFWDMNCPTGGKWYACSFGSKFVGCCTSDPCTKGCTQGNVRAAGFNITHYGEMPDGSCGAASNFYSCVAGPSFWGCCKSMPCATGTCPDDGLVPAFMERPEQFNAFTSSSSESSPQPSSDKSNSDDSSSGKTSTGAIVGGVVGGVVVIIIIAIIAFVVFRRRRNNKKTTDGNMGAAAMMPMMNNNSNSDDHNNNHNSNEKSDNNATLTHYGGQSPPPTYSAPIQNSYQTTPHGKGHESYHQYASHANEPQELPTETVSSNPNRYSELPADASNNGVNRRYSELPAGAAGPAGPSELESPYTTPYVTPAPLQEEFTDDMAKRASQQGLGLSTGHPK